MTKTGLAEEIYIVLVFKFSCHREYKRCDADMLRMVKTQKG